MIEVVRITKTCEFSPAQWDGETADGRFIYVRYRWGWLRISVGDRLDEAIDYGIDDPFFYQRVGGEFDGEMDYQTLKDLTGELIAWPEVEQ